MLTYPGNSRGRVPERGNPAGGKLTGDRGTGAPLGGGGGAMGARGATEHGVTGGRMFCLPWLPTGPVWGGWTACILAKILNNRDTTLQNVSLKNISPKCSE